MFELKVYTLIAMTFVYNFLNFPTYNCEVTAKGNALKDTVRAIEYIRNFIGRMGESLQEILSTSWTLGELLW
jgi:DNA relaxase NicK